MCPSTETTPEQGQFAVDVLRNLLQHIENENNNGHDPYLVSHAWTEGSIMYLVYSAPPSDRTWGLVRDTRESIIDPGPWPDLNEAVLYYYLVDLEENQPSAFSRRPSEPDTIRWRGDRQSNLPEHPSDIRDAYRYTPPTEPISTQRRKQNQSVVNEPRRYGNPL